MGFSAPKSSLSGRSTPTSLAEINVTPLVDVMLVLLVVFMISAPLMQQGVQIDLPKAQAQSLSEAPKQVTIQIDKARHIINTRNWGRIKDWLAIYNLLDDLFTDRLIV